MSLACTQFTSIISIVEYLLDTGSPLSSPFPLTPHISTWHSICSIHSGNKIVRVETNNMKRRSLEGLSLVWTMNDGPQDEFRSLAFIRLWIGFASFRSLFSFALFCSLTSLMADLG
jgi:hypothetical protein